MAPLEYDPYSDSQPTIFKSWASAGSFPAMVPNALYRDGHFCGTLPHRPETVMISRTVLEQKPEYVRARLLPESEWWVWCARYPCTVNGRQLKVDLPCAEIVRSILATSSHIARALFAGNRAALLSRLVDHPACWSRSDPFEWHLALRHLTSIKYASVVGLLVFDRFTIRAVDHLFSFGAASGQSERDIQMPLPFASTDIAMTLLCHPRLDDQSVICATQIMGISPSVGWVGPRIFCTKPHGRAVEDAPAVPSPFDGSGRELNPLAPIVREVAHDPDARSSPNVGHINTDGFALNIFRKAEVVAREASVRFVSDEAPCQTTDVASTGDLGPRQDGAPRISINQAGTVISDRFAQIVDAFAAMHADGLVIQYGIVAPPEHAALIRNGYPCWPMKSVIVYKSARSGLDRERARYWALLDYRTGRVRTALVIGFKVRHLSLIWVELDVRVSESNAPLDDLQSVVAKCDLSATQVADIVSEIDEAEGVVSTRDMLANRRKNEAFWVCRHQYTLPGIIRISSMSQKLKAIAGMASRSVG
jgi:hypothetical protein